ncbi:hypothetical protein E2C01_077187 [Portunus trituberculatus]|uniref:Uncharacterized protein n=1 Tax=Portunus trituberculatus TaxID=210409 RepID=A0A5B7IJK9_PORTR|nr:hypothetical protein [Portunus trituberculatus]
MFTVHRTALIGRRRRRRMRFVADGVCHGRCIASCPGVSASAPHPREGRPVVGRRPGPRGCRALPALPYVPRVVEEAASMYLSIGEWGGVYCCGGCGLTTAGVELSLCYKCRLRFTPRS